MSRKNNPIAMSAQAMLNHSYDTDYDLLCVEIVEFDGTSFVRKDSSTQQMKVVVSGGYTYICRAPVGTAEVAAGWQAFRMDNNGNKMYANADSLYDNVATDPTVLNYSYS